MTLFDKDGRPVECDVTPATHEAVETLRANGAVGGLTWAEARSAFLLHGDHSGKTAMGFPFGGGYGVRVIPEEDDE